MNAFIKSLREEGYTSLKDQHYDTFNNFPALNRTETNKTPDPDTTDLENQYKDGDDDDESDKSAELVDPNKQTLAEEISPTDPVKPVETAQEETTSPTDPTKPDETTQDEEVPLTVPEKSNEISPTKTPNDTTPAPPDQSPIPPTIQTPDVENLDPKDATDIPPKSRVRGCSVSMKSMLEPPSSRLPTTPTSPSQSLFPPSQPPQSTPSPSSKSTQGLGLLEFPMIRHMSENRKYTEDKLKLYVIEAIKQGEITYKFLNDEIEESSILSDGILKVCRENAQSNQKKDKYNKIKDQVTKVSRDPDVKAAAREKEDDKKKGRLASQSDMTEQETLSKLVRIVSPKMKQDGPCTSS